MLADGCSLGMLMVAFDADKNRLSAAGLSFLESAACVLGAVLLKEMLAHSLRVHADLLRQSSPGPPEATVVILKGAGAVEQATKLLQAGIVLRPQGHAGEATPEPRDHDAVAAVERLTPREQQVGVRRKSREVRLPG